MTFVPEYVTQNVRIDDIGATYALSAQVAYLRLYVLLAVGKRRRVPFSRDAHQHYTGREQPGCRLSELLTICATESGQNVPRKAARSYRLVVPRLYHPFPDRRWQLSGRFSLGGLARQLGSLPSGRHSGRN